MTLPQCLSDAAQYLKTQLAALPEGYPEIEQQLIDAWVEFVGLGEYETEDIIAALKMIKCGGVAEEIIEQTIEDIEDYSS